MGLLAGATETPLAGTYELQLLIGTAAGRGEFVSVHTAVGGKGGRTTRSRLAACCSVCCLATALCMPGWVGCAEVRSPLAACFAPCPYV